jgi:hypothetical protein
MTARYAVYDTVTDRDIREFDDLPHAYALIDQLKQRHGSRYAVRTTREHRDRIIQTVQVLDDFLCAEQSSSSNRWAADVVQSDEQIGPKIPEAMKHLAKTVERFRLTFSFGLDWQNIRDINQRTSTGFIAFFPFALDNLFCTINSSQVFLKRIEGR